MQFSRFCQTIFVVCGEIIESKIHFFSLMRKLYVSKTSPFQPICVLLTDILAQKGITSIIRTKFFAKSNLRTHVIDMILMLTSASLNQLSVLVFLYFQVDSSEFMELHSVFSLSFLLLLFLFFSLVGFSNYLVFQIQF